MGNRLAETGQERSDRLMNELVDALTTTLGTWSSQQIKLGATGGEVGAALIRAVKLIGAGVYRSRGCCKSMSTLELAKILLDAEKELVCRLDDIERNKE